MQLNGFGFSPVRYIRIKFLFMPLKSIVHMNQYCRIVKRDFITGYKFQNVPCLKRTLSSNSIHSSENIFR